LGTVEDARETLNTFSMKLAETLSATPPWHSKPSVVTWATALKLNNYHYKLHAQVSELLTNLTEGNAGDSKVVQSGGALWHSQPSVVTWAFDLKLSLRQRFQARLSEIPLIGHLTGVSVDRLQQDLLMQSEQAVIDLMQSLRSIPQRLEPIPLNSVNASGTILPWFGSAKESPHERPWTSQPSVVTWAGAQRGTPHGHTMVRAKLQNAEDGVSVHHFVEHVSTHVGILRDSIKNCTSELTVPVIPTPFALQQPAADEISKSTSSGWDSKRMSRAMFPPMSARLTREAQWAAWPSVVTWNVCGRIAQRSDGFVYPENDSKAERGGACQQRHHTSHPLADLGEGGGLGFRG
jgi:hypothetical protein